MSAQKISDLLISPHISWMMFLPVIAIRSHGWIIATWVLLILEAASLIVSDNDKGSDG
jgi:hypothetical protein